MSQIALVSPEDVVDRVVPAATIDPNAGTKAGWRWLPVVTAEAAPAGKVWSGPVQYEVGEASVQAFYDLVDEPPPPRRTILKSLVTARLIAAGKIGAAYQALNADPSAFARWFAPDHGEVYADDSDALALLAAIGADAEVIMAP